MIRSQLPREEDLRAALEAELQAAAQEYEDELLAKFNRLPRWISNDEGEVRYHYWNGEKWVEFDLDDPPLWVAENLDPDGLAAPLISFR